VPIRILYLAVGRTNPGATPVLKEQIPIKVLTERLGTSKPGLHHGHLQACPSRHAGRSRTTTKQPIPRNPKVIRAAKALVVTVEENGRMLRVDQPKNGRAPVNGSLTRAFSSGGGI
jgi:hypothetical protein